MNGQQGRTCGDMDYWERRAIARQRAYDMSAEKAARTVRAAYMRAQEQITADMENILRSFRENYNLDRETAIQTLNEPYTKGYLVELRRRLGKMENGPEKRALMARLNAASYRARITRLEAAQMSVQTDMALVAGAEVQAMTQGLRSTILDSYNRTTFDLQKGAGVIYPQPGLSVSRANQILRENWTGMNYSKRVWRNTEHVAELISQAMEEMAMTGSVSVRTQLDLWKRLKGNIRDSMEKGEMAMQRLFMTEWSHVNNQAEKAAMIDCGMEKYRFDAVLDKKTSSICRDLDGEIFPLKDAKTGKNYPPMHPWCRSLAVAVIDRKFTETMKRRATDPKTGEVQEIPYDMTYREWEAWQKAGGPKDIGAWRNERKSLKNKENPDIIKKQGIFFDSKQYGKKSGKHARDYGLDPSNEEDRDRLQGIIKNIHDNADYSFSGVWRGQIGTVNFFVKGQDAVLTKEDGEFITIMKGGTNNTRLKNQRK